MFRLLSQKTNIETFILMKICLSSLALLLFVFLLEITQIAAVPDEEAASARVGEATNYVLAQDWLNPAYEQYYSFGSPAVNSLV
jgi:hypothetical protein